MKVTGMTVGAQMNDALEQFSLHNLRHVVGFADLYELMVLGGRLSRWKSRRGHGVDLLHLNVYLLSVITQRDYVTNNIKLCFKTFYIGDIQVIRNAFFREI